MDDEISVRCSVFCSFIGLNCQTNINECASNPCLNEGMCIDDVAGYKCICTLPYTGKSSCRVSTRPIGLSDTRGAAYVHCSVFQVKGRKYFAWGKNVQNPLLSPKTTSSSDYALSLFHDPGGGAGGKILSVGVFGVGLFWRFLGSQPAVCSPSRGGRARDYFDRFAVDGNCCPSQILLTSFRLPLPLKWQCAQLQETLLNFLPGPGLHSNPMRIAKALERGHGLSGR